MIIKIKSTDGNITIPLPSALVMNGFALRVLLRLLGGKTGIPAERSGEIAEVLRRGKRLLRGMPLVYIKSGDGEEVLIKL